MGVRTGRPFRAADASPSVLRASAASLVALGFVVACGAEDGSSPRVPSPNATDEIAVVQGILSPNGEDLVRLGPVRRLRGATGPALGQTDGRFSLEVEFADGTSARVLFDGLVADDAGKTRHGFFEVTVAAPAEISVVRVVRNADGRVMGELQDPER